MLVKDAVGGESALDALDTDDPLPDEPFGWDAVPADVHGRSSRYWSWSTGAARHRVPHGGTPVAAVKDLTGRRRARVRALLDHRRTMEE